MQLTDVQRIAIEAAISISNDIENARHDGSFLTDVSVQALRDLLAAPAQSAEPVANTLAEFKAAFFNDSKRALTEQDIFDAGVRSGMSRAPQPSPAAVALADYRRGTREAFDLANMINANRQGRTAEETCTYLVRSLAELTNGGDGPSTIPARESWETVAWPYEITRGHIECLINDHQRDGQKQLKHGLNSSGSYLIRVAQSFRWCLEQMNAAPQPSPTAVDEANAKRFPTPISISTDKICEIAGKYNLGNPCLDALRGFVNEVIIVNEAEYAKSE